jgi:hypothetical protein
MDRTIDSLQRLTNMHTPETDALYERLLKENPGNLIYLAEMLHHARQMERERDEANYFLKELAEADGQLKLRINELCEVLQKTEKDLEFRRGLYKVQEQYLEAARAELAEWKDSALNARKEYDDEHHCSCVPILRKLLKDAERERDEARLDKRGG